MQVNFCFTYCKIVLFFRIHLLDHLLQLLQGIIGYICGSEGLDSSGLSSSAAVSFFPFHMLLL